MIFIAFIHVPFIYYTVQSEVRALAPPIKPEKLYAEFNEVTLSDKAYVQLARKVAAQIRDGEKPDINDLAFIREAASKDIELLKGDYVISAFLTAMTWDRWANGKCIDITETLAEKIYRHHFKRDISVKEFCEVHFITRNKYYRVVNCDVKYQPHKEQLQEIKARVAKEFEN